MKLIYDYWRSELPDTELPLGIFSENFTTTGLKEEKGGATISGDRNFYEIAFLIQGLNS
jgi:hypothetical protein